MFELPKVLVIDDDEGVRATAKEFLSELGYEAVTAKTAKEGAQALGKDNFAAILLDLVLPDLHGHALLRHFERMEHRTPVIILSGEGTMDDVVRTWHEGAKDYVQKPFDVDDLDQALSRVVESPAVTEKNEASEAAPPAQEAKKEAEAGANEPAAKASHAEGEEDEHTFEGTQEDNTNAQIRSAVSRLKSELQRGTVKIPVLNPRVTGLVDMLNEENMDMDKVVEVIGTDAALASAILRAANSPCYNRGKKIESLQDACVRLGTKNLITISFEVVVRNLFTLKRDPYRKMSQAMWRNAVVTSLLAGKLAEIIGESPGVEFIKIKALLHNVGELLVVQLLSELANEKKVSFREDQIANECVRLHETFGYALAKSWGLPPETTQLAGNHHNPAHTPEPEREKKARHVVLAAWKMALQAGYTYLPEHGETSFDQDVAEIDVSSDKAYALVEDAREWEV